MSEGGAGAAPIQKKASNNWSMTNKYSRVCVTINLKDGESWEQFNIDAARTVLEPAFMVFGQETGAEGRKHFQGYMEWDTQKRKAGQTIDNVFRKVFSKTHSIHYEKAMGTAEQNITYCTKEDKTPYIYGEPTGNEGQGTRMDAKAAFDLLKNGGNLLQVAEGNPHMFLQFHKGLAAFKELITKHNTEPRNLIFLWGPTGTGKTCHAQEVNPQRVYYTKSGFYQGYDGDNKAVLFDDFNWKEMPYMHWLTLTDRYNHTVNVKGGSMKWTPSTIVFTSNDDPKTWWTEAGGAPEGNRASAEHLAAIHRRMDEFGKTRYLGTLVPHTEKILTDYFLKKTDKPAEEELPPTVPLEEPMADEEDSVPPAQPPPSPQITDLTGDSDEEVRSPNSGRVIFAAKRQESETTTDEEDRRPPKLMRLRHRKIGRKE